MFVRKPGSMVGTVESPAWLIKRIAWRMQANHEGALTERARQRARELTCDADLRLSAPRMRTQPASTDAPIATTPQPIALPEDSRPLLLGTNHVPAPWISGFLFLKLQKEGRS